MNNKPLLASKAVWLGIAMSVVSILGLVAGEGWIQEYPVAVSIIGLVAGILTVVIRHFTTQPLATRKKRP